MTECSACGAELAAHETRCPICGKPTAYYHRQRRCLHCGTPAAEKAHTCLMCGKPVDSLPLNTSIFSGSWLGIGLGVLIIVGIVMGLLRYQGSSSAAAQAVPLSPTVPLPTATLRPTGTPPATPATATSTPSPTTTATPTATATPTPYLHEVAPGENPSIIADKYGIAVEALIEANNIEDVSGLQVGQKLIIPGPSGAVPPTKSEPPPGPTPAETAYEVKGGDTLLGIALAHGTTVEAIQAANPDINLDLIFPGQMLIVPLATPTITPTPTTPPTATPTPGPLYDPPQLLSPAQGQVVKEDVLLFQWTSTGILAQDEFYVLQLTWANGTTTEHWVKNSSWRVTRKERPAAGPVTWTVTIKRQTGTTPEGSPQGLPLISGQQRTVEWP